MMKITVNCPDDTRVIGVVTIRGGLDLMVDQKLREAKDSLIINMEEQERESGME